MDMSPNSELFIGAQHSQIGVRIFRTDLKDSVQLSAVCGACDSVISWNWHSGHTDDGGYWYCDICHDRFANTWSWRTSSITTWSKFTQNKDIQKWIAGWLDVSPDDVTVSLKANKEVGNVF